MTNRSFSTTLSGMSNKAQSPSPTNFRAVQFLVLGAQFIFALAANTIQPLLPTIQEELGLSIFASSALPTIYTVSLAFTNLAVGFFIGKLGIKRMILGAGILGVLASLLAFLSPSFAVLTLAYIAYGFAIGSAFTSLTTLYSHLPERYRDFGLYHAFFGIGGIVAPLITGFVQNRGLDFHLIFLVYLILMFVSFLVFLLFPGLENRKYQNGSMGSMVKTLLGPLLIMGIAVMGTYAAAEIGIVTYAGNQHIGTYSTTPAQASLVLSGFWVVFTLSRFITDPLARRFGTKTLVLACVGIAFLALIGWILGAGVWTFLVIGLALGPIFPAMQKFINNHLPDEKKGLFNGGTYASLGAITSLVLPLMGSLGEGGIQRAFIPSAVCLILLFVLVPVVIRRLDNQP